jgi:hypothetical protein
VLSLNEKMLFSSTVSINFKVSSVGNLGLVRLSKAILHAFLVSFRELIEEMYKRNSISKEMKAYLLQKDTRSGRVQEKHTIHKNKHPLMLLSMENIQLRKILLNL